MCRAVTGSNTSPDVSYVWGPGQAPITQSRTGGSVSHFITDGLGSVRGLANSSQAVTDTLDYEAFGKVTSRTGTTPLVYEFALSAASRTIRRAPHLNPRPRVRGRGERSAERIEGSVLKLPEGCYGIPDRVKSVPTG